MGHKYSLLQSVPLVKIRSIIISAYKPAVRLLYIRLSYCLVILFWCGNSEVKGEKNCCDDTVFLFFFKRLKEEHKIHQWTEGRHNWKVSFMLTVFTTGFFYNILSIVRLRRGDSIWTYRTKISYLRENAEIERFCKEWMILTNEIFNNFERYRIVFIIEVGLNSIGGLAEI